jgi:methyl-accepting chemotaxis protein
MIRRLKIKNRLALGFGLMAALMTAILCMGIYRLSQLSDIANTIVERHWASADLANKIISIAYQNAPSTLKLLLISDNAEIARTIDLINSKRKQNTENYQKMEKLLLTPNDKELFAKIQKVRPANTSSFNRVSQLVLEGNKRDEATRVMIQEYLPALNAYITVLQQFVKNQDEAVNQAGEESRARFQSTRAAFIVLGVIAVLFGLISAYLITRSITRPLDQAVRIVGEIAQGNMTANIDVQFSDEVGEMLMAMKRMLESLNVIASAAEKLAHGDLSIRVDVRSDKDSLNQSFLLLQSTVRTLIDETCLLVEHAGKGQLKHRGDARKFQGCYREVVEGMNHMMDSVVAPIDEAALILGQVAARDLTGRMHGNYQGDFAKIQNSLNTALKNLNDTLRQVVDGAQQVTSAANEISHGSQSLSQNASEQAATLEQVSSSLKEVSSTAKQNAANSSGMRELAQETRTCSNQGVKGMHLLSEAINKIKTSADATARIIKTIDEIAFQTNLLALNAAVEAARAGDAGKGFAVVAEEVRNLAIRSAEAAKNTAALIDEAARNVEGGVIINGKVLQGLNEIDGKVHKVSQVIEEIVLASEKQKRGVEDIDAAVDQLNQATQHVAANSEESAASAQELSSQATQMNSMVGCFKLEDKNCFAPAGVRARAGAASNRIGQVA